MHAGAGSCVILTSRNKRALEVAGCDPIESINLLSDNDAKKLFMFHATNKGAIVFSDDDVNDMIKRCGRLPLSLKVCYPGMVAGDRQLLC